MARVRRTKRYDYIGPPAVDYRCDPIDQVREGMVGKAPVWKPEPFMAVGQASYCSPSIPGFSAPRLTQLLRSHTAVGGDLSRLPVRGVDQDEPK